MNDFYEFWRRMDRRARFGLIFGVLLIVVAVVAFGSMTLRTDYQVLFAELAPQDASTMVAELDQMKVPYRLVGSGNTILVPADLVYKTRLKLAGKELPLRGAVGFELFNNSEVGMTEFAQKINYQRALQGELTRTISALDEVQSVRVHLVLAEQALFKKTGTQPKASITIAVKPGKNLDSAQIQGIQRLVGAAVPDIKPNDVTILDQHGIALTKKSPEAGQEMISSSSGLDEKRAIEAYLNKKVLEVLDKTFGAGQGIASIDVTLNHEQKKTTTESPLAADSKYEGQPTGVIVKDKQTANETSRGNKSETTNNPVSGDVTQSSREVEYQVGRKVEQVISSAGAVNHVNIAVVVRHAMQPAQLEKLKELLAAAVGIDKSRGDVIAVYTVEQISNAASAPATGDVVPAGRELLIEERIANPSGKAVEDVASHGFVFKNDYVILILAGLAGFFLFVLVIRLTRRPVQVRNLSDDDRRRLLAQVRDWLENARTSPLERN
ncbi:flagellar basal-body MS-ring/collar protein FliF [Undibacterium sp. YM2]|uniref:flagellar basal-body MS-ring/collar protein FliF n=1 Tax=Undibacterium sp. YM2 TaxID=2058625 RepID=UPI00138A3F26|nr:flagellar basal-body MS-ring/collar protein FliF [Undibacterium sp. YM2]